MPLLAALACGAFLLAPTRADAQPPNVVEANERVARGEQLFTQGDFDGALAEFEQAYEVIGDNPNRFNILFNIGQSHERRFRYDLAMRYYRRYLDEGGAGGEGAMQVQASINALEGLLATLHINVNVEGAQVWVEDRQVGTAPGDVLVTGGRHVVELRADGYAPSRQEIQIAPRTEQSLDFSLSEFTGGLEPVYFWIFAGAAVAVGLAGGGVGIGAMLRRGDVDAQLQDPARRFMVGDAERSDIETLALTADILYGTAGLLAVTAVVLAILTDWDGGGDNASESARLLPYGGPTGAGVQLEVTW